MADAEKGTSIIVVGVGRGGTSAVTSSLYSLGVFIGDEWHKPNYEDVYLAEKFQQRDWQNFQKKIAEYERDHQLFAWKYPGVINKLRKIDGFFENPRYVFVFRDIYSISDRMNRALGRSHLAGMLKASIQYLKVLNFIKYRKPDCLLISYEKMITNTDDYARRLLAFLSMESNQENVNAIISGVNPSPTGYRKWADSRTDIQKLKNLGFSGCLDSLEAEVVRGWVLARTNETPVSVDIYVNNAKVGSVLADQYRKDLADSGVSSTGKHGFCYVPVEAFKTGDVVAVVPAGSDVNLPGSPRVLA
ncbi:sulfotransferase [Oceanobacter mangrovi]|uniref:sulfotransferase n=1 Tax=Oceanobacter mangrovi TaxID=2862510 RepID=UPI001C8DAAC4|nr:sulfotransferase [Oceanobacter mangrovi]